MQTINLNQLTIGENSVCLFDGNPFFGFAIEAFADGSLRTQMSLMRGLEDGVTRRWHPNGQLESEKSFRAGAPHGLHKEWRPDGVLETECMHERRFDEQGRRILEMYRPPAGQPRSVTYQHYEIGETGNAADGPQSVIYQFDKGGNQIPDAAESSSEVAGK
jgi:hypothetical protein